MRTLCCSAEWELKNIGTSVGGTEKILGFNYPKIKLKNGSKVRDTRLAKLKVCTNKSYQNERRKKNEIGSSLIDAG
jgi:hypothetical protein